MHEELAKRIRLMMTMLNEKQLRQYLGIEAEFLGVGGIAIVAKLSGKSQDTIAAGIKEKNEQVGNVESDRKKGGGRKTISANSPGIKKEIAEIVSDAAFENKKNPRTYTTESARKIQQILQAKGFEIGPKVIGGILEELGYSLQGNQKKPQVKKERLNSDRQFEFISEKAGQFLQCGDPLISIDPRQKELIGYLKDTARYYNANRNPAEVLDHDLLLKTLKKVPKYDIYDINKSEGYVNLGRAQYTDEFTVVSLSRWWLSVGKHTYPDAQKIYMTFYAGVSDGYRNKLFKVQLQEFSNQSNLELHISHFPPGTSKWNKIEHRLFCYIMSHWKGQSIISIEAIIDLIGNPTRTAGLNVVCVSSKNTYAIGMQVREGDFENINIQKDEIYPDWNYVISPSK